MARKKIFDDIEAERLDVAQAALSRLLCRFKTGPKTGEALEVLKLLETAMQVIEAVRAKAFAS